MKKIVLLSVIFIFSCVLPTNANAAEKVAQTSAKLSLSDAIEQTIPDIRAKALQNVFKKYNSPLSQEAGNYVKYADAYNIDWKLLPAISGLESTFGNNLPAGSYNAYGWGGGKIYFDSWEDGIKIINKALRDNYFDHGAIDVWSIGPIYAESPTWAVRVDHFMQEIEQEYERLSTFTAAVSI